MKKWYLYFTMVLMVYYFPGYTPVTASDGENDLLLSSKSVSCKSQLVGATHAPPICHGEVVLVEYYPKLVKIKGLPKIREVLMPHTKNSLESFMARACNKFGIFEDGSRLLYYDYKAYVDSLALPPHDIIGTPSVSFEKRDGALLERRSPKDSHNPPNDAAQAPPIYHG